MDSKRFKIALSFPGEHRIFVEQVAQHLANNIGNNFVLYDQYYEAEFARPNLDTYLQALYRDESELIAVFLCAEYEQKDWCGGLEWRVIREAIKRRHSSSIMFLRFDNTEIPGLFEIDGSAQIGNRTPQAIADLILQRYKSNNSQPGDKLKNQNVLDFAKFITRPKEAYDHIFGELNQNSVKACFFLFTSNQTDIPMDFAIGLRESMKNNFSFQLIAEMKKSLDVDACSLVVANPWDYDQKEKFIEDCLNKIYKRLNPDRNKTDKDDKDIEKLLEKIVNVLKTAPKPIVLFSKALEEPAKKGWLDFTGQKFSKKINERHAWVDQINKDLKKAVANQGCQSMVLLFCVQVDDSFLKKTKPCFYLTNVQKQDFADWYSDLIELYPELYNTLESLLRLFKPALTYQQVLKHIEATLSPGK